MPLLGNTVGCFFCVAFFYLWRSVRYACVWEADRVLVQLQLGRLAAGHMDGCDRDMSLALDIKGEEQA